ncbi:hypothetical protein, partial [Nostoc sp. CCY 9925]|uniref:hypothetical protein n=1 Tax=Nostoc sp. CCY 9925 TaxID=3103865 RepID=UPI0039C739F7
ASALTFKYIAQPARASALPVKASALTQWQTALCYQQGEKGERAQIKNFSPQGIEQVFLNIENKKKKIFKTRSAIQIRNKKKKIFKTRSAIQISVYI